MEKSEPTLVPEWLKINGSVSGGGTTHHNGSSLLQSDDHFISKPARSRSSLKASDPIIGRNTSYYRRSSSSNSTGHSRASGTFGRSSRDRVWDWEKDISDYRNKERSNLGDHRHHDSDPLGNILPSRFERDAPRRSQSMTNGKRSEIWSKKVGPDLSNSNKSNHNGNGVRAAGSMPVAGFDRDFPSLGVEEKQSTPDIGRVSSPCLSTAIQSLPLGTSAMIGDGWTSALAEVPAIFGGSGSGTGAHVQQTASGANSLNMAEALTQGPSRAKTPPQLSAGTQKLEELAIKQSRQLIPMTPSVPKTLMFNSSSEKAKPKNGQLQQQISSSHLVNPSMRVMPKSDISSTTSSMGKLHVLKPARERNGVSLSAANDSMTTNSVSKVVVSGPISVASSAPLRNPINNGLLVNLDKRPVSQAQSRHDFFNLMRKKSTASSSASTPSPCPADSLLVPDKSNGIEPVSSETILQVVEDPISNTSVSDLPLENKDQVSGDGDGDGDGDDVSDMPRESLDKVENLVCSEAILYSEEEEAAFLRSLGWEENTGENTEEEGLTEEEISAFYRDVHKYIKQMPPSRMQPKFLVPLNLRIESVGGGVSGFNTRDSKRESR